MAMNLAREAIPGRLAILLPCLALTACGGGGGGGGGGSTNPQSNAANQIPVVVDAGPPGANAINALYASATICAPGTSNCQTIDHLLVDTGASGVRILASAMQQGVLAALPQATNGSAQPVAECMQFVSGYTWGSVRAADIKLGGETAAGAMIQVIPDPNAPSDPDVPTNAPVDCSKNAGPTWNSVATLGAKGTIGISTFAQDCGSSCTSQAANGFYYACSGGVCSGTIMPLNKQVWNPVALFPADDNGTLIVLPSLSSGSANRVNGTLTFGIGTQSNNGLGNAAVLTVDANSEFTSTIDLAIYPGSFVDSGSNGLFYGNGIFPNCTVFQGFYCPPAPQAQNGVLQGMNLTSKALSFTVSDPEVLLGSNPGVTADAELAGPGSGGADWGLPIFFGHSIYNAIEGKAVANQVNGPWVGIK